MKRFTIPHLHAPDEYRDVPDCVEFIDGAFDWSGCTAEELAREPLSATSTIGQLIPEPTFHNDYGEPLV